MENHEDETLIVSFLLGELAEDQRTLVEERLFTDDDFYSQVLAIQDDLTDDYIQGRLAGGRRIQFEQRFMKSPRRRERVEFAGAFAAVMPELPAVQPEELSRPTLMSWWQSLLASVRTNSPSLAFAASAALMLLLVGAGWLVIENRRLASRLDQAHSQRDSTIEQAGLSNKEAERTKQELEAEIASLRGRGNDMEARLQEKQRELQEFERTTLSSRTQSALGEVATFVLPPGLARGIDEPEKLIIPKGARTIQLQLSLERNEDYERYWADIRTARGNLVWSKSMLTVERHGQAQVVVLNIPAPVLSMGEYEVALKGMSGRGKLEPVGYYYIIALKR